MPDAQVSTIELDRPGPSYTVDTLEHLRKAVGDTELRLLVGSDQAVSFQQWKDWPRILELASPVVMLRPPLDAEAYEHRLGQVYSKEELRCSPKPLCGGRCFFAIRLSFSIKFYRFVQLKSCVQCPHAQLKVAFFYQHRNLDFGG